MYIPVVYRRTILECLGGDKLFLTCPNTCLTDTLKTLHIVDCSFIPVDDDEVVEYVNLGNSTILSKLESLSMTRTCFGNWSCLIRFRRRRSLIKAHLHCLHIGPLSMNGFNWSHLSRLAQNLRQLGISSTSGRQALDSIASHLSEFHHLVKFILPINY